MDLCSNIYLKNSPKAHTRGLDKAISPEDTLKNVKSVLKQTKLNLVNETIRIDSRRLDIPVFVCVAGEDCNTPARKFMGKGHSPDQAEASALMELIERFSHANFPRDGSYQTGKYPDIKGDSIPLDYIFLVPNKETAIPEENKHRFTELPFSWVPAYSLVQRRDFLIPYEWFADIQGTNGLSAGNTLEETILQGLCEVVERHVSSLVNSKQKTVPTIDLFTVKDPVARELISKYLMNGIKLIVKDFSLNTGIPTLAGIAFDPSTYPDSEIVFCAGTATNPEKALIRVLTEIQQMAVDYFRQDYYVGGILPKFTRIDEARYLLKHHDMVPIDSLPDISADDITVEIENCTKALSTIGFEPLVVNITHPTLGIPSVFVILPGAELYENTSRYLNTCYFLARRFQHLGRFQTAIEWYQRSISEHPSSSCHSYLQIAHCYKYLERYQEAIDNYRICFRYGPDRAMQYEIYDSWQKCHQLLKTRARRGQVRAS